MAWLESLPVRDVAESWGLSVDAYNGRGGAALGRYRHGTSIALGVENLSTWAHELVHAADDRLGQLKERGQHWRSETVAELGGAILLEILGHDVESDRRGLLGLRQRIRHRCGYRAHHGLPKGSQTHV